MDCVYSYLPCDVMTFQLGRQGVWRGVECPNNQWIRETTKDSQIPLCNSPNFTVKQHVEMSRTTRILCGCYTDVSHRIFRGEVLFIFLRHGRGSMSWFDCNSTRHPVLVLRIRSPSTVWTSVGRSRTLPAKTDTYREDSPWPEGNGKSGGPR